MYNRLFIEKRSFSPSTFLSPLASRKCLKRGNVYEFATRVGVSKIVRAHMHYSRSLGRSSSTTISRYRQAGRSVRNVTHETTAEIGHLGHTVITRVFVPPAPPFASVHDSHCIGMQSASSGPIQRRFMARHRDTRQRAPAIAEQLHRSATSSDGMLFPLSPGWVMLRNCEFSAGRMEKREREKEERERARNVSVAENSRLNSLPSGFSAQSRYSMPIA